MDRFNLLLHMELITAQEVTRASCPCILRGQPPRLRSCRSHPWLLFLPIGRRTLHSSHLLGPKKSNPKVAFLYCPGGDTGFMAPLPAWPAAQAKMLSRPSLDANPRSARRILSFESPWDKKISRCFTATYPLCPGGDSNTHTLRH